MSNDREIIGRKNNKKQMLPPNYEDGPAFIIYFNEGNPLPIQTNQKFVDFFSKDQPQTYPSSASKKQNTIADIKYLVAMLYTTSYEQRSDDPNVFVNDDPDTIRAVKEIVREKYDCRFPVVFYICDDNSNFSSDNPFADYFSHPYGEDEFLRTYGLGQFLYSAVQHKFLLPEETGDESVDAESDNSVKDDNLIIAAFMKERLPLSDLQIEHLKMYITPLNIIQRLRHDGGNAKTLDELSTYEKQLNKLLTEERLLDDVDYAKNKGLGTNNSTNQCIGDTGVELEKFKLRCDKAEELMRARALGKRATTPIYALLLDDRCEEEDMQSFIKVAKSRKIYITPVKTVREAEEELVKREKIKGESQAVSAEQIKYLGNDESNKGEQIIKDLRYTVILVDLLLKEQHNATGSNSNCNLLVSRRQGYDFIRDLARMGRQYGVILLSTLPRNFKTMVAGSLPLRTRNFPYKDGGKLAIPEYQQLLIDMIVEAHDENNEEAIFRAFTKRGFAMHYIRYMNNNKGFEKVNEKTKKAIESFLNAIKDGKKNWEKKENENSKGRTKKVDESQWLSKLSTKYAPVMNEGDVNANVEEFLNNIYSWSWESYCEQGCPSAPLSDEQKSKINKYCREQISKNDNSSNPIIKILKNNDNIISAFIEDCYNSTLSFKTTFELYKQKEEVRDFVKRLFIYKDAKNKYPDNDSLTTRFIARRLTLFLFFWANLSKYASDEYVGTEVTEKNSKGKNKSAQGSSTHTLTAFDCVNQILNRNGLETPKEFDSPTSLVNNGVWLNTIYFQRTRTPECPYMTPDERDFFLNLFQDDNFQFELKTNDEQLNTVLNKLEVDQGKCPRTMCSELIYYFK